MVLGLIRADAQRYYVAWSRPPPLVFVGRLLITPGFRFSLAIRFQGLIARIPLIGKVIRRLLWFRTAMQFSSDIDPSVTFGPGVYFPHPFGIVIGLHTRIGGQATILQGVTIGRRGKPPHGSVNVEDDVEIGAGAVIVGDLIVGRGSKIGANAIVLKSLEPGTIVMGPISHKRTDGMLMHVSSASPEAN